MKKAGKGLALLLVATMIISLFAGMNTEKVRATIGNNGTSFKVLEIVPNVTMAQFGYLVRGQEPVDLSDGSYFLSSRYSNSGKFKDALKNANIGEVDGSGHYTSNQLLSTGLPDSETWTVTVDVRTPETLDSVAISNADLIVFTETVAADFPTGVDWAKAAADKDGKSWDSLSDAEKDSYKNSLNINKKTFKGNDFTWDQTLEILKKVAGVGNETPITYIMDYSMYKNSSAASSKVKYNFKYAGTEIGTDELSKVESDASSLNCHKLFLSLEETNPATFYGLYIATAGESFGINETNGALLGYGIASNDNNLGYQLDSGEEYSAWSEDMIFPYFATSASGTKSTTAGNLGWATASKSFSKIFETEGTVLNQNRGITYNGSLLKLFSSKIASELVSNVQAYKLNSGAKNSRHQYRVLSVSPNGIDNKANYSLVTEIAKYLHNKGQGMVEGAVIDCISVGTLNNLSYDLTATYDAIYFSDHGIGSYSYKAIGSEEDVSNGVFNWSSGTGSFKSALPGNDLTSKNLTDLKNFVSSGKPVVIDKNLDDSRNDGSKVGDSSNMRSFLNDSTCRTKFIFDDGTTSVPTTVMDVIESKAVKLDFATVPAKYISNTKFDYVKQSGSVYQSTTTKTGTYFSNYQNYINDASHATKRSLDFDFTISGGSSEKFTVNLYIDIDADGKFNTSPGKYEKKNGIWERTATGEKFWTKSEVQANQRQDYTGSNAIKVLPDNYVGAVTWKFEVVSESDAKVKTCQYGYSACRNNSSEAVTINLLQIVPVSNLNKWGETEINTNETDLYQRIPCATLLLPTKKEAEVAKKNNGDTSISAYKMSYNDTSTGISKIQKYFDGVMKVDIMNAGKSAYSNGIPKYDKIKKNKIIKGESVVEGTFDSNGKVTATGATIGTPGKHPLSRMVALSGYYYYYLSLQSDFDISVTRLSSAEFNKLCEDNKITYDGELHYIDDYTGQSVVANMVMMGFCQTMDNMGDRGLNTIRSYVADNHALFVGNGVVTPFNNSNIAVALRDAMGMNRYDISSSASATSKQHGFATKSSEFASTHVDAYKYATLTNHGTTTEYPYAIPEFTQISPTILQPFQLDAEDPDIVTFCAIWDKQNSNKIGDTISNYYLYKKNNITFCAYGFNEPGNSVDDVGSLSMKLPEAALLVNVLLTSSDLENEGTARGPYVETTNEDRTSIEREVKEKNSAGAWVTTTKYKDYLYVDFDATSEITPGSAPTGSQKNGIITDSNGKTYLRHELEGHVAAGSGDMKIVVTYNDGGTPVEIDIPLVVYNSNGTPATKNSTDSTRYLITDGGKYYVDIPLFDEYYTGIDSRLTGFALGTNDSFDYKIITRSTDSTSKREELDVTIQRRGLFLIN